MASVHKRFHTHIFFVLSVYVVFQLALLDGHRRSGAALVTPRTHQSISSRDARKHHEHDPERPERGHRSRYPKLKGPGFLYVAAVLLGLKGPLEVHRS